MTDDTKTRSTRAERKRRKAAKEAARIEKQAERRTLKQACHMVTRWFREDRW